MVHAICGGGLRVELDTAQEGLTIFDSSGSERLLIVPNLHLCIPELADRLVDVRIQSIEGGRDSLRVVLEDASCLVEVRLQIADKAIVISSKITVKQDCELIRLSLLPAETSLNFYDVVNFRHRHYTAHTWPELLLGGNGCETDTYSRDWQFAPHPSMIMLRKAETTFCLGALDLSTAFGMYFKASEYLLKHWYLDYGSPGYGHKLAAGEVFHAPEMCLFLDRHQTPYQTVKRYTDVLIEQKRIPDPAEKVRYPWHQGSVYCTWMDQGYLSGVVTPVELSEQQPVAGNDAPKECSEALVRQALHVIEAEQLPFQTILIDDGWQVTRGQWEPHPERFPDLRSLVDAIHARGMKVIVWWNWAEIFDDAVVDPAHLVGQGWRNRHGQRVRDYSHPKTQRDYLEPLFYKLLSSDAGCYDLDGIKTDFLADKVHPELTLYDREWRGEENYFYRLFRLFYQLMRRYKPDACHIGCAGHPYLAEYIDVNRTYDVATSNVLEHLHRAYMLESTTPGCPVAFDLHNFVERFNDYFATAKAHGASVHVGNILGMKRDTFSDWELADKEFYAIIRQGISQDITP